MTANEVGAAARLYYRYSAPHESATGGFATTLLQHHWMGHAPIARTPQGSAIVASGSGSPARWSWIEATNSTTQSGWMSIKGSRGYQSGRRSSSIMRPARTAIHARRRWCITSSRTPASTPPASANSLAPDQPLCKVRASRPCPQPGRLLLRCRHRRFACHVPSPELSGK
jgi:hypothetical protein